MSSSTFDTEAVKDQLEDFQDSLQDLKDALAPLEVREKNASLSTYMEGQKLDSIGKAKLFVTIAYSIDSLLFCHLKATGTNTEKHTIMSELQRVKQYVTKIKEATAHQRRNNNSNGGGIGSSAAAAAASLDKAAAYRMVGHALAGNNNSNNPAAQDRERAIKTAQSNRAVQATLEAQARIVTATSSIGKHTRFENSGIMQEPTERLVPRGRRGDTFEGKHKGREAELEVSGQHGGESDGRLDDVLDPSNVEEGDTTAKGSDLTDRTESMFEETKAERKNRERRERKAAKKERQRKLKVKQAARADKTST